MSMQETQQREFHALLNECDRIHWKNLELEMLIHYANIEKRIWEEREPAYSVNHMHRVVEIAESLNTLREER